MLELAQALAECDQEYFKGWVIAGLEAEITGTAQIYSNEILQCSKSRSIILVRGKSQDKTVKQMKVFLVLPRQIGRKQLPEELPQGKLLAEHIFSADELNAYISHSGDENIIHQQPRPVVPGLLLLSWLQQAVGVQCLKWSVRFMQPVYAGEAVAVYEEGQQMTAYVNGTKVLLINKE